MFGGGGGLNPRKMQQMMEQMGIDVVEIDASEVTILTEDGEEYVFEDPDVTRMDARGQETFQIVGDYDTREATTADDTDTEPDEDGIPQADVEIVAQRTGVDEATAREALEDVDGDLAAAVDSLDE